MIQGKQRQLLLLLCESSQPLTAKQLSEQLGCSIRTVKNYVAQLNCMNEVALITSSRQGYLAMQPAAQDALAKSAATQQIPQTFRDRAFYLIRQILIHHAPLDVFDLAEQLFISYATLKADIAKMNQMFAPSDVKMVVRRHHLQVEGTEKNKRRLVARLMMEEAPHHFIDRSLLTQNFNQADVEQLEKIIKEALVQSRLSLNDDALLNLMLHLLIMIQSIQHYQTLVSRESYSTWLDKEDATVITRIIGRLEQVFSVSLNKHEREEIHMLFHANMDRLPFRPREKLQDVVGQQISDAMQVVFSEVKRVFGIELKNEWFTLPFGLHLKKMYSRAMQGSGLNSPLTDTLQEEFPVVFELALFVSNCLNKALRISISAGERAYLALHLGAELDRQKQLAEKIQTVIFTPHYTRLSEQLYQNLSSQFGRDLNIVATVNDFSEIGKYDAELLITTAPQPITSAYQTVTISPFMTAREKRHIMDVIEQQQARNQRDFLDQYFDIYFDENSFFRFSSSMQQHEVIAEMCTRLERQGLVPTSFRAHVFEREAAASTAFGEVAIPHSVYMEAKQTTFSIGLAKDPISWGTHHVRLVILTAISQRDQHRFMRLYDALITMFGDEKMVNTLSGFETFGQFKDLVKTKMNL